MKARVSRSAWRDARVAANRESGCAEAAWWMRGGCVTAAGSCRTAPWPGSTTRRSCMWRWRVGRPTLTQMSRCGRRDAGVAGYGMHGMRRRRQRMRAARCASCERRRMRVARYGCECGGCVVRAAEDASCAVCGRYAEWAVCGMGSMRTAVVRERRQYAGGGPAGRRGGGPAGRRAGGPAVACGTGAWVTPRRISDRARRSCADGAARRGAARSSSQRSCLRGKRARKPAGQYGWHCRSGGFVREAAAHGGRLHRGPGLPDRVLWKGRTAGRR